SSGGDAGAGRGRPGLADRLHQRVEPADRARHQPSPGARSSRRPRRLARAHHPVSPGGERVAGGGGGGGWVRDRLGPARAGAHAIAWTGVELVRTLAVAYIPRSQEIALDGATGAVLISLTVVSALLFGLIPAMHGTGGPVDDALRSWGRWSTGSVGVRRMRRL